MGQELDGAGFAVDGAGFAAALLRLFLTVISVGSDTVLQNHLIVSYVLAPKRLQGPGRDAKATSTVRSTVKVQMTLSHGSSSLLLSKCTVLLYPKSVLVSGK